MAGAVVGSLRVVLGLDTAQFEKGFTAAQKHLRGVGKQMQSVGVAMAGVGAGLTAAVTAPLIAAGFAASKAANESRDAMAQVEAALKSMGNVAGQTKESLAGMATDIMRNSLYDDDDVLRKVTANLLTFGKIAGDEFRRAQVAAVDLAARMGTDLQSATILVGKALNDPVRGMGALRKAGVQLDENQQKLVKSMVATGDVAGAQRILLGELEAQFGGAAKAAQDADPYDSLRDSLNDLSESMGAIINQYLKPFIDSLAGLANRFNALSPEMQRFALIGAVVAAAIGPALVAIGGIVAAIGTLTVALASGGVLAGFAAFVVAAAPFIAAAAAIGAAIWIFRDDLVPIFDEFKKAVMDAIGPSLPGIMAGAQAAFAALGPAISAVVGFVGPILAKLAEVFLAVFGPVLITMLKAMAAQVEGAFKIITNVFRFISALLTGDFAGAWRAAGSIVGSIMETIGKTIDAVFPGALRMITGMVDGVKRIFTVDLFGIFHTAVSKVKEVGDAFFNLYDRVVGHSYVPDMVTEVGQWMAKLDAAMVAPARAATSKAAQAFADMRAAVGQSIEGVMTDREKLDLGYSRDMAEYQRQLAAGVAGGGMTQAQYDLVSNRRTTQYRTESAGIDGANLQQPNIPDVTEGFPEVERLNRMWSAMQDRIRDSREAFADSFSRGMEAAVRGDWQGVLESVVGMTFNDALKNVGKWIFDKMGGSSPGGFSLGNVGSIFSSISSFFTGAPKFANGGSIVPGGAGSVDSQYVQLWKSPSEQVDVYTPGTDGGPGGGGSYFDLRGAVMTQDLVNQMNQIGQTAEDRAYARSMKEAPALAMSQMARKQMHSTGRRSS